MTNQDISGFPEGSEGANRSSEESAVSVPTPEVLEQENRGPTDEEVMAHIEKTIALVGPILKEIFAAAAEERAIWLKGASARILGDWIVTMQNHADIMQQQIEAMGQYIADNIPNEEKSDAGIIIPKPLG